MHWIYVNNQPFLVDELYQQHVLVAKRINKNIENWCFLVYFNQIKNRMLESFCSSGFFLSFLSIMTLIYFPPRFIFSPKGKKVEKKRKMRRTNAFYFWCFCFSFCQIVVPINILISRRAFSLSFSLSLCLSFFFLLSVSFSSSFFLYSFCKQKPVIRPENI